MYPLSYSEILDDAPHLARERERKAFDRALQMLHTAETEAQPSAGRTAAIGYVQDLWNLLLTDLLDPANAIPEPLKADLVSIGSWAMREVGEALRAPERSLQALIEVNTSIRDGLR